MTWTKNIYFLYFTQYFNTNLRIKEIDNVSFHFFLYPLLNSENIVISTTESRKSALRFCFFCVLKSCTPQVHVCHINRCQLLKCQKSIQQNLCLQFFFYNCFIQAVSYGKFQRLEDNQCRPRRGGLYYDNS